MSTKPPSLILDPDRVIDALPALFDALERFSFQTNRFVRYLEEAQRGDPRQYLRYGIDEGFTATRIARRTINQLDDIIVRVRLTVQALQEHDQRAQVMMVCVAPPTPPNVATTNVTSGASIVNAEDIIDNDDYGTEPPPSHITDFLDQVLGPDMRRQLQNYWGIISFGGDAVLSFFVIGDIIDILYNLYLGLTGQEVDELTLIFAALGLASDLGWLQPVPSAEDAPNAIFAILKAIVKRLPKGKTRDRLTELLQQAASDPKVANRLQAIFSKFLPRPDLIPWLCNPKVLMAILNEGPEFVDLLLKHGDDAFKATDVLGKNAYSILKQYDEIASIPGANQILKDLGAGGDTTRQAARTIKLISVQQIKELTDLFERRGILWSGGLENMFSHVFKHFKEFSEFSSPKEYVLKAKDFSSNPPKTARIKKRNNGDLVIWDPVSNIFVAKEKTGHIRTMFKPDPKVHGFSTNEDYFNSQSGIEIKP